MRAGLRGLIIGLGAFGGGVWRFGSGPVVREGQVIN